MSARSVTPPGNPATPYLDEDRREWLRFDCVLEAVCQPVAAEFHWQGQASDISAGGVALVLARRFEPGTLLAIGLKGLALQSGCMPLARVQRAKAHGLYWQLGCTWADELGLEELKGLLGAYTMWKSKEKQRKVA